MKNNLQILKILINNNYSGGYYDKKYTRRNTKIKKRKKCRIRKVSITILCFIMHFICSWTFVSGILQCSGNYFCTEYKMIPVIIFLFRYSSRLRYRSGSVS